MKSKKFLVAVAVAMVAAGGVAAAAPAATEGFKVEELPLVEKMTLLALQIGLILFAAKLGGRFTMLARSHQTRLNFKKKRYNNGKDVS